MKNWHYRLKRIEAMVDCPFRVHVEYGDTSAIFYCEGIWIGNGIFNDYLMPNATITLCCFIMSNFLLSFHLFVRWEFSMSKIPELVMWESDKYETFENIPCEFRCCCCWVWIDVATTTMITKKCQRMNNNTY